MVNAEKVKYTEPPDDADVLYYLPLLLYNLQR